MKFSTKTVYKINPELDANDKDRFMLFRLGKSGAYFHRFVDGDENAIDKNHSFFNSVELSEGVLIEA